VEFGILASGVVHILEDMDGIQGIGGLVVDGMAGVGTDMDGDRPDLDSEEDLDGEDADLDGEGLEGDRPDLDSEEDLALDSEGGPDLVDPEERLDLDNMEGPDLDNEGESKGT
jgi:hypothetical protein